MKEQPEYIVGETSKNWPNSDQTPIAVLLEQIVNTNFKRGYELVSFSLATTMHSGGLTETIVAVFRLIQVIEVTGHGT